MNFFDNDDEVHHLDLDRGNLTAQSIRGIAVLSVLIASACVLATEKAYCLFEYYGKNNIVELNTLTGGISKDPMLFGACGIVALLLFLPLLCAYHRAWYAFFLMILLIAQWIILTMIESPSIGQLIYDSVVYCQNYGLLAWVIGQCIFIILSAVFIFYEFRI